jgi:hypothetical protein
MSEMDRRHFLARAALGSAAVLSATSLGGVAVAAREGEGDPSPVDGSDPTFFEGLVVSAKENTLVATSGEHLVRRLRVGNATQVWKAGWTTFDQIRAGDYVYARGVPAEDGDFIADALWANIVNLHVEIADIASGRLMLNHVGGPIVGHLLPSTVVAYNVGPETRDLSRIRQGLHLQIVGAWRPGTDEVQITRVYAPI